MIENMEYYIYIIHHILKKNYKIKYGTTEHSMTFNNKTNKFLICGPDEYKKLY